MKRELTCIVCPNGCELIVEIQDGKLLSVQGATCKRGHEYAERELTNPMRTVSTSVLVEGGEFPLVSVRLNKPIPKSLIFEFMDLIKKVRLEAPVHIGQIVVPNVCGCDSNAIVTKNIKRIAES